MWLWVRKGYPIWNPGKWNQGTKGSIWGFGNKRGGKKVGGEGGEGGRGKSSNPEIHGLDVVFQFFGGFVFTLH